MARPVRPGSVGLQGIAGERGTEGLRGLPDVDGSDGVDGAPEADGKDGVFDPTSIRFVITGEPTSLSCASWAAWGGNHVTLGWWAWLLSVPIWETYALWFHPGQVLTAHLRPIFLSVPFAWWVGFGRWLWIGIHLLAAAIERGLMDRVRG